MSMLVPNKVGLASLPCWLHAGWQVFLQAKGLSAAYASIFAVLGLAQFYAVVTAGLTPLVVALAGGFMLIGPALLCGFFNVSDHLQRNEAVSLGHFFAGFRLVPPVLWVVSLFEMFLFLIWLTDTAMLLLLPLFPVVFPVLAYASRQAYREVFPQ